MSAIPWEEYLTSVIELYRKRAEELIKAEIAKGEFSEQSIRDQLEKMQKNIAFFPPCQIEVIKLTGNETVCLFVTFDQDRPDKEIIVAEVPKDADIKLFVEDHSKSFPQWLRSIQNQGFFKRKSRRDFLERELLHSLGKPIEGVSWSWVDERSGIYFLSDPRADKTGGLLKFSVSSLESNFRGLLKHLGEIRNAKEISSNLKEKIKGIGEEKIRGNLLDSAKAFDKFISSYSQRLEDQERLITAIKEDVSGVRQLVGVSKEYQDWKLLVSDVGRLKGEHVPREVFNAKVSELSTQIASFKEIKEGYEKMLNQQTDFMKQQSDVMKQQSSFITWIKYATILVPIAVILAPIIDTLVRHFLGIL